MAKLSNSEGSHTHEVMPDLPPDDLLKWLHHRGWQSSANYGYFVRNDVRRDGLMLDLTWEQAIAYEMYKIITIGGYDG